MIRLLGSAILAVLLPAVALAHYPYYLEDKSQPGAGNIMFVFEEGPAPGDGQYLDPFVKNGTFWLRTPGKKDATTLKFKDVTKDGKRWLALSTGVDSSRAIDCHCKWGVYQGKLLHYYARHLHVTSADHLAGLARAEKLRFELVPRLDKGAVEIQVLWDGKPDAGRSVLIAGPQFRTTAKSDAKGLVRFEPKKAGLYTMRTQFIDAKPEGTDGGKKYSGVRHTTTLSIDLPIPAGAKQEK